MEVLHSIWQFIQNQILGMKWLNEVIGIGLSNLGIDTTSRWGGSIQFFVYNVIKIMVLLGVLIFIISYIQSYFPPERTKRILGRFHGIGANCIAALLGTVTPFCSCSSIPLFIGFTSAGLPLGVTFSFLISSPMVDLGSLVLLMSIFGWKVAVIYVVLGLVIAVIGGTMIEKLHLENEVEEFIRKGKNVDIPQDKLTITDRLQYAWEQVVSTAKKVAPYVLVGVGIGAFMRELMNELFNMFVGGNLFSAAAMTRTLMECCVYGKVLKQEKSARLLEDWFLCGMIRSLPGQDGALRQAKLKTVYALCSAWNREPEETIRRFKKGNENEWLVSVIPGKGRIYFSHVCEYLQETELYQTYQWACAFVHGQDIRSKIHPFTFYDSTYHLLTVMMSYIFRAIRLYPVSEELEAEMQKLERDLAALWGTTSWDKNA